MTSNKLPSTGRRKTSSAKVFLIPGGTGNISINSKDMDKFFGNNPRLKHVVSSPFDYVKDQKFDCKITVRGGGCASQAGAIRHGIARAIASLGESFHLSMKRAGFLTRDPRMVERKKPGKPKARKRFQFSKR